MTSHLANFPTKNGKRTDLVYPHEPERPNDQLVVRSQTPFNAEPPLPQLVSNYVTPSEVFFKRNHGPIPLIKEEDHSIKVEGLAPKPLELSVQQIKDNYPKKRILAALQCAGNRRAGLLKVKPVKGVIWGSGTIANAYWAGACLRDILIEAGIPENLDGFKYPDAHVWMEAYGDIEEDLVYGSSIPLRWAMNSANDVILAYEMNDQVITRDHGFPVRMVVPGVIGARSVKFLHKIIISNEESHSFFQRRDYKILPSHVEGDEVHKYWDSCPSIHEMNVQSVICTPAKDQSESNRNEIQGYAISGGGRQIVRVELTFDKGQTWHLAQLQQERVGSQYWSWCLWKLPLPSTVSPQGTIACRAWDAASNTQPELPIWNFRGVMNNCWDSVEMSDLALN